MSAFRNIYCRLYDSNSRSDLILDECSTQVLIADVHASVTISQRFTSPEHLKTAASGVYTFGMMADAAVCGFEMVRQDGTKVEGTVKEKEEAKREYDAAVKAGHTASLGRQETSDIFSIAVGNILPSETVTINLRYVMSLMDDEKKDQCSRQHRHQPFQMNVVVQQAGAIKSISCPSGHPVLVELGIPDNLAQTETRTSSHFASVSLADNTGFLTQDVVLVISAEGLDAPRCFIERHPSPNHETAAIALTFVPRFNLPDLSGGMEYVFLVDRSGSMQGQNLQLVQEALVVLLRGLPSVRDDVQCCFVWVNNFEAVGTQSEVLSNYTGGSDETCGVANYGGTEIASALKMVYDSLHRPIARPVAVFLLTDGSAWDVSTCVQHTRSALAALTESKSFIRVFTVGIGNGASSDTCDSIARAGGGFAVYVKQGEAVVGKCARLVKAARTPQKMRPRDDFVVVEDSKQEAQPQDASAATINLFDDTNANAPSQSQLHPTGPLPKPNPSLPPPARIQQSPLVIPSVFPGTRTQIYAIIRSPNGHAVKPMEIKVKGIVITTGALVELRVPVSTVLPNPLAFSSSPNANAFLHTLAAKSLIRDREDGTHAFPSSVSAAFETTTSTTTTVSDPELKAAYLEKDIVRLGTTYGLASRYTSFLAVDPRKQTVVPSGYGTGYDSDREESDDDMGFGLFDDGPSEPSKSVAVLRPSPAPPPPTRVPQGRTRSKRSERRTSATTTSSSGQVLTKKKEKATMHTSTSPAATPTTHSAFVAALARLQQWHGGFLLTVALLNLLRNGIKLKDTETNADANHAALLLPNTIYDFEQSLARHSKVGIDNRHVAATLVAVVWMEKYAGEEVADMQGKAEEWAKQEVGAEKARELRKSVESLLSIGIAA
ncbi:hypothetical protein BT96DRAFT_990430 [Gymnopus androsaceus JB14]|uniref:VIT-domain-containing protein n=1 Tax=Gymnopus androsaceus JB14 TaxID=1447944 RepID=A0A6A4HY79_9AGAR|nr:hypothetical protein BT96DRAFT_990430 [Gymnopus androsaceus JB14]